MTSTPVNKASSRPLVAMYPRKYAQPRLVLHWNGDPRWCILPLIPGLGQRESRERGHFFLPASWVLRYELTVSKIYYRSIDKSSTLRERRARNAVLKACRRLATRFPLSSFFHAMHRNFWARGDVGNCISGAYLVLWNLHCFSFMSCNWRCQVGGPGEAHLPFPSPKGVQPQGEDLAGYMQKSSVACTYIEPGLHANIIKIKSRHTPLWCSFLWATAEDDHKLHDIRWRMALGSKMNRDKRSNSLFPVALHTGKTWKSEKWPSTFVVPSDNCSGPSSESMLREQRQRPWNLASQSLTAFY